VSKRCSVHAPAAPSSAWIRAAVRRDRRRNADRSAVRMGRSRAFLLGIAAQAAHSVEETIFRLYDVFPPARIVRLLACYDPAARGCAPRHIAPVGAPGGCYVGRARRGWPSAGAIGCFWAILELINGSVHIMMALAAGGYFPGAATAPLLLGSAALLVRRLL